jgi:FKBP-type peptidyl-prolyl cis-trans isomerase SlyD
MEESPGQFPAGGSFCSGARGARWHHPDEEHTVVDDTPVRDGLVVGIEFVMRLDDGEIVDTTEGEEPLEILQGGGELVEGLEKALYGMKIGERKQVVIPPHEGFGEVDDEGDVLVLARDEFPPDVELEPGMELYLQTDEDEDPMPAYIVEVDDEEVVIDWNHPLAGETLHVDVTVRSIRQATRAELEHGHAHGDDWDEGPWTNGEGE